MVMNDKWKSFYQRNLGEFGPSAKGVGWKNSDAQTIRFRQLMKVFNRPSFSLNDLGCGVGDFVSFAEEELSGCDYRGYDIMDEMVTEASRKFQGHDNVSFHLIKEAADILPADYTIASGICNRRINKDNE